MSNMSFPTPDEPTYTGCEVLDDQHQRVGKVTDVIYDSASVNSLPAPTWLVVDPGMLRAAHYVPVHGSYRTDDGTIVVPWDKDWIKSATKASGDHLLSPTESDELLRHYALA